MGVGVGDTKGRATEIFHKIDCGPPHQIQADWVDHQLHSVGFGNRIVGLGGFRKIEFVSEPGAAAAIHRKTKDRWLLLSRCNRRNPMRRALGQGNFRVTHQEKIGSAAKGGKPEEISGGR